MSESKRAFNTVKQFSHYEVPNYTVVDGKGIEETGDVTTLIFVRGSKISGENVQPKVDGTLHEHILSVMIEDLKLKWQELPSRETEQAIYNLQQAQHWLEERVNARAAQSVLGTYKPHNS